MAKRPGDTLRDWLYTIVGLAGLGTVIVWTHGNPNPVVIGGLCALAGRPIWGGLADLLRRRDGDK